MKLAGQITAPIGILFIFAAVALAGTEPLAMANVFAALGWMALVVGVGLFIAGGIAERRNDPTRFKIR